MQYYNLIAYNKVSRLIETPVGKNTKINLNPYSA